MQLRQSAGHHSPGDECAEVEFSRAVMQARLTDAGEVALSAIVIDSEMNGYQGDFVAWNGGCLFIGSGGGVVQPLAHYAIQ
jgi:hypothetical protein